MIVTQHKKDGDYHSFNVQASEYEVGILINIALATLIAMSQLSSDSYEEQEIDLNSLDINQFYTA